MQTIKTAVVVVLLMVILYGAFVAMNGQQADLPPDLENMIAMGPDFALDPPSSAPFTGASSAPNLSSGVASAPAQLSAIPASTSSDSPFAMWPGAASTPTDSTANAQTASITDTAAATPVPPASLLLPPSTIDASNPTEVSATENLEVAPPSLAKVDTPAKQETAPTGSDDPWLKTLQNSVGSVPKASSDTFDSTVVQNTKLPPPPAAGSEFAMNDAAKLTSTEAAGEFTLTSQSFENAKKLALEQAESGKLKEGLQTLSVFYNSPELTSEQRADLLDMLDALSYEVIYSRRHELDLPYIVAPNEKLQDIAQIHEIPLELLARINGIQDVNSVMPGTKLKVVKGPFRGEIDIEDKEMTLFLGELYAGRFPISTGRDPEPREGVFQVVDKQKDRNYYGPGGIQIDGKDPRNPYGGLWLDLGQQLSIHGSPANPAGDTNTLGCVSLSPLDASDVFIMLSRGSQVTIKR